MLGTGRAHVSEICELARSNIQDGLPSESLVAFSSLGANGVYTSNQERDLHRWLHGLFGMELTPYKVPMKLTVAYLNLSFYFPSLGCCMVSPNLFETINTQVLTGPFAQLPAKAFATEAHVEMEVPFLLPHEILHSLAGAGDLQAHVDLMVWVS